MMQIESYKKKDPAMSKQLAVPVDIPNYIYCTTRKAVNHWQKVTGEMILIAFYFLLRVREYIHYGCSQQWKQQFQLQDICFFTKNHAILLESLEQEQEHVTIVSLTIDNQKMATKGTFYHTTN